MSSPTVAKGAVYVGSADGKLSALDAATGAIRWQTTLTGAVTTPTIDKDLLYAGSGTWLSSVAG